MWPKTRQIFISSIFCICLSTSINANSDLFDDICGETFADRIISGNASSLAQYPWMARLEIRHQDGSFGFDCGGVLITKLHVLSAAHCAMQNNDKHAVYGVLLGELHTEMNPDCEDDVCADETQFIRAESISIPDGYDNPKYAHDIVLIKLAEPAQLTDFVSPICLPMGNELVENNLAEVAGWGLTDSETEIIPTVLQYAEIQPMAECERIYRTITMSADRQICAGGGYMREGNQDSCSGDSGGPLMQILIGDYGPRYYVTGLVSFGLKRCGSRRPAVYTKVLYYLDFILKNIDKNL